MTAGALTARHPHRYRLTRAGVLNVWQYDEQVFDLRRRAAAAARHQRRGQVARRWRCCCRSCSTATRRG